MGVTVGALRRRVAGRLRRAFADADRDGTPDLDARVLAAHLVGCDPSALLLKDDHQVGPDIERQLMVYAARRIAGEPVARIVGRKAFYGIDLALSPATLVPRPDTETLVDAALELVRRQWGCDAEVRIVDLGTGSGAILLSLLSELPNATGLGLDVSAEAVVAARDNARRLGLSRRAMFAVGHWMQPVGSPVDVFVANPPYIETDVIPGLAMEVRDHDPRQALDGGADGLESIRAIIGALGRVLGARSCALVEIGLGQAKAVGRLAIAAGLAVRFDRDLTGIERVAILTRSLAWQEYLTRTE